LQTCKACPKEITDALQACKALPIVFKRSLQACMDPLTANASLLSATGLNLQTF
jgi:hypothetical protein